MKTKLSKLILLCGLFALLLSSIAFAANAVGVPPNTSNTSHIYHEDWKYWSQGASKYPNMRDYGCRVVAYSKLLMESGVVSDSSFNPDVFFEWGVANGYFIDTCSEQTSPPALAPGAYARQNEIDLAVVAAYDLTGTKSEKSAQIMSYLNQGYYVILGCDDHFTYVSRERSLRDQTPVVYDSWSNTSYYSGLVCNYLNHTIYNASGNVIEFTRIYLFEKTGTLTVAPVFTSLGASEVTETSALISASLKNPGKLTMTRCWINMGLYPNQMAEIVGDATNLSDSVILFTYPLDEYNVTLSPGTTYYYQLCTDFGGQIFSTDIKSFTTAGTSAVVAPEFTSLDVSEVTETSALISARLTNPGRLTMTRCWINMGLHPDQMTEVAGDVTNLSDSVILFTYPLDEYNVALSPGTTYYYQLCTDFGGQIFSSDIKSFSTETSTVSGACGDNLTWTLTEDGTLTISGTGEMYDYGDSMAEGDNGIAPWFEYRNKIVRLTISKGVTGLCGYAVYGCTSLEEILVDEDNAYYCSVDGVLFDKNQTMLLRYPVKKAGATYNVPDSVTSIATESFLNCSNLTSVEMVDGVTTISYRAFYGCNNLSYVGIPDSVIGLGDGVFMGCNSLTNIKIPDGVMRIGFMTFAECTSLTWIQIPSTVTSIDMGAFSDCVNMETVYYNGTQTQWNAIAIEANNDPLLDAQIICAKVDLTAPVVTASVNVDTGKPMLIWDAVPGAEKYEIFRCDTANGTYIRMTTITGTTYTNGTAVAGKTYYYKVRAVKGTTLSACSEICEVTCKGPAGLAAPVVTGSVNAATGKPMLTWKAVPGAEKYEIFRCDTANGTYIRMYTTTATTYSNGSAVAGKTYYYKVRAVAGSVYSATSAIQKVTCAAPAALTAPVVTASVKASTGKPTLTWKAVSGAEKYEIFRCDTANGTYIRMYTTTATTYSNGSAVAGKTYYYKVRAVKGTTNGPTSTVLKITCAPAAPVVTSSVNAETGEPTLTWKAVAGAEKYEIFRCDTANGTYIRMTTITGTTYSNGSAVAGKTYYYKVRAVVGTVNGACSAVHQITCTAPAALTAPVVKASVNAATGKPTLTWNAVAGAEKYEIFRCDTANGTYIRMYTTTATTYSNGSAVAGRTYYYKVRAVKGTTNGPCSAVLQVTCAPAAPVVTSSVDAKTGKPTLTWDAIAGAEKYEIFRCDTANGTYIRMYTTTATTYSNGSAVAGKTYYYKVRAVVGTVNGACSAVKKITCAYPATAVSVE